MSNVTHSSHHAQPKKQSAQLISPAEFLRKLLAHDWHYAGSDDSSVYRAGQFAHANLVQLANTAGPVHQWLFNEVAKHFSTEGLPGTEPHPLPAPPTEVSDLAAMTIRVELAAAEVLEKTIGKVIAFLPAKLKAVDPVKPVLEKVFLLGFYAGTTPPPALIAHNAKLRTAWDTGQRVVSEVAQQAI